MFEGVNPHSTEAEPTTILRRLNRFPFLTQFCPPTQIQSASSTMRGLGRFARD
jgi:hypothetical protein